jgi:class 3 adenylate cyclase
MDDVRAVMDAVGSERASIFGVFDGAPMSTLFAATYPERTCALILDGAIARSSWAQGYPWGTPDWDARAALEDADVARSASPNATEEERAALVNYWRHGASPGARIALMKWVMAIDVRDVLPAVRVPTLILQHGENPHVPRDAARFVADQIPGATYVELHDRGNIPAVAESEPYLREVHAFLERAWDAAVDRDTEPDRVLATVLFTDIVAATEHAARLGDRGWRDLLQQHHELVRRELLRYRGVEVDTAGDGFFASFDGPARAIRCACAIADSVQDLGIAVRAGLHTGECEVVDGKVTGIAVHTGARVASQAQPSEVLVSSTVRDLVAGSGIEFEDRGTAELKGIPGEWRLFAVAEGAAGAPR